MFTHDIKIRVLYADTDQMGYVYYANYARYYEQARAEAIRSVGLPYKQLEESGTMMPITRMNVKYIQPAYYDELLTIKTTIPHLPNRIIIFRNYKVVGWGIKTYTLDQNLKHEIIHWEIRNYHNNVV